MERHLLDTYPAVGPLPDLIRFQKHLVILPGYEQDQGKAFPVRYDWPGYFEIARCGETQGLPEPTAAPFGEIQISDTTTGDRGELSLDWGTADESLRWANWITRMLGVGDCGNRTNFKRFVLKSGALSPS